MYADTRSHGVDEIQPAAAGEKLLSQPTQAALDGGVMTQPSLLRDESLPWPPQEVFEEAKAEAASPAADQVTPKTVTKKHRRQVINRHGEMEDVRLDAITDRMEALTEGLHPSVDTTEVTFKTVRDMTPVMTTRELDELTAKKAANMVMIHPDYSRLAARILTSDLHKSTKGGLLETYEALYNYVHPKTGKWKPLIARETLDIMRKYEQELEAAIRYERDMMFDMQGIQILKKSYLLRMHGEIIERPQHMYMRVAVGIHGDDLPAILDTYEDLSLHRYTHATPTLFNAGTPFPQMSSCFLLQIPEDSIESIYDTKKCCAIISKFAGGIGVAVHRIRAQGSFISGTNGESNGLVPMLHTFNADAVYVDQGGGKRKGSFAIYLEPWHADVFGFLDLKKLAGAEQRRARDLNLALWIPDLFMQRVKERGKWSLFCPAEAPGLFEVWGEDFERLYRKYEATPGLARKVIDAEELWRYIVACRAEYGQPYMLFKDAANRTSNQQHLGTIQSSNLCTEIIEYTSKDEIAVCNLASVSLPACVVRKDAVDLSRGGYVCPPTPVTSLPQEHVFDLHELGRIVRRMVRNLNRVIDRNYYSEQLPQTRHSNLRHRPMGIGVQGLANVFYRLRLPFDSPGAYELNRVIFETIYYHAVAASIEEAKVAGPYETFPGSPASKGKFQFDLWGDKWVHPHSGLYDWEALRKDMVTHGLRNSLLVAPMPTASTANILGNVEGFSPIASNIFSRQLLSGEFLCVNREMVEDLLRLGLWSEELLMEIKRKRGSILGIERIPRDVQSLYRTKWELRNRVVIEMAAQRGVYVCQSQSMDINMPSLQPEDTPKVYSADMLAWELGLITGAYYTYSMSSLKTTQFTVKAGTAGTTDGASVVTASTIHGTAAEREDNREEAAAADAVLVCTKEDGCISCSG